MAVGLRGLLRALEIGIIDGVVGVGVCLAVVLLLGVPATLELVELTPAPAPTLPLPLPNPPKMPPSLTPSNCASSLGGPLNNSSLCCTRKLSVVTGMNKVGARTKQRLLSVIFVRVTTVGWVRSPR